MTTHTLKSGIHTVGVRLRDEAGTSAAVKARLTAILRTGWNYGLAAEEILGDMEEALAANVPVLDFRLTMPSDEQDTPEFYLRLLG